MGFPPSPQTRGRMCLQVLPVHSSGMRLRLSSGQGTQRNKRQGKPSCRGSAGTPASFHAPAMATEVSGAWLPRDLSSRSGKVGRCSPRPRRGSRLGTALLLSLCVLGPKDGSWALLKDARRELCRADASTCFNPALCLVAPARTRDPRGVTRSWAPSSAAPWRPQT